MTKTTIRPVSHADIPDLIALQTALLAEQDAPWQSAEDIDRLALRGTGARVLMARDAAGAAVGYALMLLKSEPAGGQRYDVAHLFVTRGQRSRGIGRALLSAAQSLSDGEGRIRLTIGTPPQPVANLRLTAVY